jgi:hypothetical protein
MTVEVQEGENVHDPHQVVARCVSPTGEIGIASQSNSPAESLKAVFSVHTLCLSLSFL